MVAVWEICTKRALSTQQSALSKSKPRSHERGFLLLSIQLCFFAVRRSEILSYSVLGKMRRVTKSLGSS